MVIVVGKFMEYVVYYHVTWNQIMHVLCCDGNNLIHIQPSIINDESIDTEYMHDTN